MKFRPKDLGETANNSRGNFSALQVTRDLALILVGFSVLALVTVWGVRIGIKFIPDSWEAKLNAKPSEELVAESPALEKARFVFQQLLEEPQLRQLNYELILLESEEPNAFALPGGTIALTSGLLETVNGQMGLAMVLGHELGHIQERHGLERLGVSVAFKLLGSMSMGTELPDFFDPSLGLIQLQYSQSQETEADEIGLRLVHEVFGHTRGALEFFEMMANKSQDDWIQFFSTHPLPSERIEHLREFQHSLESIKKP